MTCASDCSLPDVIYEDDIYETLIQAAYLIFFNQRLSAGDLIIIETLIENGLATRIQGSARPAVLKLTPLGMKARDHLLILERVRRKVTQ